MNQLLNATIEIIEEGKTSKGKYGLIKKLKAKNIETGQTNTWTIYETKSDGGISAAWTQYQSIGIGAVVSVGYAEQTGQLQDGTPYTSRIIRNFDKDIGNGHKQYLDSQPAKTTPSGANLKRSEPSKDQAFWEKQAYEKCCSIWAAAHIQAGKIIDGGGVAVEDVFAQIQNGYYWGLFEAIKKDGEKRFSPQGNIKVNSAEVQSVLDEEPPLEEPLF